MRRVLLLASHLIAVGFGFALGIYFLPILTAPPGPETAMLEEKAKSATFSGTFDRNRAGSDFLHWGEGVISLSDSEIVLMGKLAPGPDYMLYLTTEFVEDEAGFEAIKANSARIGQVKTFDGLILPVPEGVSIADYTTVVIWCEAFSEFITSAQYQ